MLRRHLLALPAAALAARAADGSLDVSNRKQLLFDTKFIESSSGLTHTVNLPARTGEQLLRADAPWERDMQIGSYSSILRDQGKIRLWYNIRDEAHEPGKNPDNMFVAYAESSDGLHFEKPILNLIEHRGSRRNNFVMPADPALMSQGGGSVNIDTNPACPPSERYKSWQKIYPRPNSGIQGPHRVFVSPDGIRWRLHPSLVTGLRAADTQPTWFWEPRIGKYIGYSREWVVFSGEQQIRMASYNESANFFHWSNPHIVLEPDEADFTANPRPQVDFPAMTMIGERLVEHPTAAATRRPKQRLFLAPADASGQSPDQVPDPGAPLDIYGPGIIRYDQADSAYIALYSQFHHWGATGAGPDTGDIALALSRDGLHFQRPGNRFPYLRLGPAGSFDSQWIWALPMPVPMGDELWIYYVGSNQRHSGSRDPNDPTLATAISRAVLRLDGFVSADFAYTGGTLLTPPMRFSGSRLELNLDTSGGGMGRVAILDEHGLPIPGYTMLEADQLNGNRTRMTVAWKGRSTVAPLAARPIRLLFKMRSAKLFAFQFTA
ncbi:MAG: hypothetical protein J0L64_15385 [Acidobacteria bacterium]|nr:hypothetical protein [Acidobacteriota bacterium]